MKDKSKLKLFFDQNGLCYYCETPLMSLPYTHTTFDHKIPKTLGGTNQEENLCLCCTACNQLKSHHSESAFKAWIQKYKKALQDFNQTFYSK